MSNNEQHTEEIKDADQLGGDKKSQETSQEDVPGLMCYATVKENSRNRAFLNHY